jgi:hypothetical protein
MKRTKNNYRFRAERTLESLLVLRKNFDAHGRTSHPFGIRHDDSWGDADRGVSPGGGPHFLSKSSTAKECGQFDWPFASADD